MQPKYILLREPTCIEYITKIDRKVIELIRSGAVDVYKVKIVSYPELRKEFSESLRKLEQYGIIKISL